MKYKLTEKAWKIDLDKIEEGFMYSEMSCYAETRNKARAFLLREYRYSDIKLRWTDKELSYCNIPVIRCPEGDKYLFEGNDKTIYEIDETLHERERLLKLDLILMNNCVTYCYIKKGGYYRPNSSGYTDFRHKAGVYTKKEAVSSAKSCRELTIIPIDIDEHNKMINEEIDDLKTRIIEIPTYLGKGLMQLKTEETHHEYIERIKRDDPISYYELTSDPTGVGNRTDFSGFYLLFLLVICFLTWFFIFNK